MDGLLDMFLLNHFEDEKVETKEEQTEEEIQMDPEFAEILRNATPEAAVELSLFLQFQQSEGAESVPE